MGKKPDKYLTTGNKELKVRLVSDATGQGVERMARAALIQYRYFVSPQFIRHSFVKTTRQINRILDQAEKDKALVVYTMTDRKLRKILEESQYDRGLDVIDMLGPLLRKVGQRFKKKPVLDSGLLPDALGDRALKLAKAIDFTLEHDDGKGLATLGLSDVILLGVSRTNKTPTSMYLSCHNGLKVANIPLAPQVKPPEKIFNLKRPILVGLTISPQKLSYIRRNRFKGTDIKNYTDLDTISQELDFARKVFNRINNLKLIDVTHKTIEEVAGLIVC